MARLLVFLFATLPPLPSSLLLRAPRLQHRQRVLPSCFSAVASTNGRGDGSDAGSGKSNMGADSAAVVPAVIAADAAVDRRTALVGLSSLGGALAAPLEGLAKAEWSIDVKDWKVNKKLDSVTRIKALALLQASFGDPAIAELKVTKVPLGSMATGTFEPKDQFALADYFDEKVNTGKGSAADVARIMRRSIEAQAAGGRSTVKAVFPDATATSGSDFEAYSRFDNGKKAATGGESGGQALRRYVKYSYETSSCARLDVDGGCDAKPERRRHVAVVTVGLETQARTQAELLAMEAGEMEVRQIDVLWVAAASAPVKKWDQAAAPIAAAIDSFTVPLD